MSVSEGGDVPSVLDARSARPGISTQIDSSERRMRAAGDTVMESPLFDVVASASHDAAPATTITS